MPPHTPRQAVIEAAGDGARGEADLIVTVGGGSITDGAKAVQLCLANDIRSAEAIDDCGRSRGRTARSGRRLHEAADGAADHGADDAVGRRVQRDLRRHRRAAPGQGAVPPSADHPARRGARPGGNACTRRNGCGCRPASAPSTIASRASARARRTPMPMPRRCTGCRCWRAACRGSRPIPRDLEARLDCQIGSWLSMAPLAARRADGREPRHRLCAGRGVRHPARPHLVHHAAGGDALEQAGQRRRARRWSPPRWAIPARTPATCSTTSSPASACRAASARSRSGRSSFDTHRRAGDGHAVGAAQPAADRRPGAGSRDPGIGGLISFRARLVAVSGTECGPQRSRHHSVLAK